jgi:exopolysaccharide biosynthesis polyprenyl glycosylphosphotransferase
VQLVDGVTTAFSFVAAYFTWDSTKRIFPWAFLRAEIEITTDFIWKIVLFSAIWVIILTKLNAYTYQRFTSLRREIVLIAKTALIGTLILLAADFILRFEYIPRTYVATFFVVNLVSLGLEKTILFQVARAVRESGKNRKQIIIAGNGETTKQFIKTVEDHYEWGLDIIGLISEHSGGRSGKLDGQKILGSYSEIEKILHQHPVDEVIISVSGNELAGIKDVIEVCEREGIQVRLNSDFFGKLAKGFTFDQIYGLPIVSLICTTQKEWSIYLKRLIDILVSGIALIILSPVFFVIAILIRLTSEGPVFYEWNVIGFNKRPFRSYKFRTMVINADQMKEELLQINEMKGPVFKIKDDPRITKIGKILRKYSLDELPQLWSVLKGDMSLVGPRPAFPHELARYESWHRRKLSIKPGITCLWQVNGRNKINDFDEWVKLDLIYIENWSIWLDLEIILKTIPAVLRGKGL